MEHTYLSSQYFIQSKNVSENFTSERWMDKRLVIAPWKVELVQRYFSAESAGTRVKVVKNMNLDGREKSNCPPPPQMSISKMTSQSGNQEDQGTSPLPRVQISYSRPKISSLKVKEKITSPVPTRTPYKFSVGLRSTLKRGSSQSIRLFRMRKIKEGAVSVLF